LKKLVPLIVVVVSASSCTSVQKASISRPVSRNVNKNENPRFLEDISITSGKQTISSTEQQRFNAAYTGSKAPEGTDNSAIESQNALIFKYAILLNLPVETSFNMAMLEFIDEWYGVPYRYGGTTKNGVDCSAFVSYFMSAVYGLSVPRNSGDQYEAVKKIRKTQLVEGDLVFFDTGRGRISHVGVYLGNNKFVHASTSNGVIISDLDEDYFSKRYVGSGRVR
jgi:lipoprotein Spr